MAEPTSQINVKVQDALEQLRPFFEADGGNITLENIDGDTAYVRLHGSCISCTMSHLTIKTGVEEAIKKVAPDIKKVVAINALK